MKYRTTEESLMLKETRLVYSNSLTTSGVPQEIKKIARRYCYLHTDFEKTPAELEEIAQIETELYKHGFEIYYLGKLDNGSGAFELMHPEEFTPEYWKPYQDQPEPDRASQEEKKDTEKHRSIGFLTWDQDRGQWYLRGFSKDPQKAREEKSTLPPAGVKALGSYPAEEKLYLINGVEMEIYKDEKMYPAVFLTGSRPWEKDSAIFKGIGKACDYENWVCQLKLFVGLATVCDEIGFLGPSDYLERVEKEARQIAQDKAIKGATD